MSLSFSRNSTAKAPHPPAAALGASTSAPRTVTLQPVLQLMTDPSTSSQFARHAAQLTATLQALKTGFNAQVARDGVPQVLAFIARAIKEAQPDSEALHEPLAALLQHCGQPIVCTTLNDQRVHVEALEGVLLSVGAVLELPQQVLRVTAANVLRQIFSQLRTQCYDDINKNPNVTFHKKKDLDRAITPGLVSVLLAAWRRTIDDATEQVVKSATSAAKAKQLAEEGGKTRQHVDSSSDDDDASPAASSPSAASPTAAGEKPASFEMIVLLRALLELTNYRRLCERVIEGKGVEMAFKTLQLCGPGDQLMPLVVEALWNILTLCPEAAPLIGQRAHLDTLGRVLIDTLSVGYKLQERELRNDIIVVLCLLAKDEATLAHFSTELVDLLLILGCGAESGRTHPAVNPTYHATTSSEDMQAKMLAWDALAALCRDADTAAHVFDWGFFDVLLAYVNVNCEIPAVVSWSTLQVLDIQGHILRLLNDLMDKGCTWFAASHGPATLRSYIDECPKLHLRNQAVGVLATAAATKIRRGLIDVGAIPLAIALLEDTSDLDLRIDCLNLLSDTVRREPDLQRHFDEYGGVAAVLPLLTLVPDEYTDLLEDAVFAAVDCVWQCIFGIESNEAHFVAAGGVSALLGVLEASPADKVSLPLSCLADLMQNPAAAQQCREWRSPRTGRSGAQIALSFWVMERLEPKPPAESVAENHAVGLESIGARTHKALSAAPPVPPPVPDVQDDLALVNVDRRESIREPPMDIEHLVATQPTNFKVFAMMAILGFEGHSELDADERATLAAVERFLALCKDEVWENIEESLAAEGIAPIAADREVLTRAKAEAEERSTRLLATRRAYDEIHRKRKEESERTYYQSLIKKTEERPGAATGGSAGRPMGLSITEAKIRKAQMLKASFKQAVGQSQQGTAASAAGASRASEDGRRSDRHAPQAADASGDAGAGAADEAEEAGQERWDPGQRAMRDDEYEVLTVLNEVRTNPQSLIPVIEEKLQYLDESGSTFYVPGCDPETCVEGAAVYHEAIEYLRSVRPLVTLLDVPVGMVFAARDHVADLGGRMDLSADGSDKSTPQSRLRRYANHIGRFAQLIASGQRTPVGVVMQLVVDDGVSSRVNRLSIFDPDARLCGLSLGPHSIHDSIAVILLAHEFSEINAEEQRRVHESVLAQHAARK